MLVFVLEAAAVGRKAGREIARPFPSFSLLTWSSLRNRAGSTLPYLCVGTRARGERVVKTKDVATKGRDGHQKKAAAQACRAALPNQVLLSPQPSPPPALPTPAPLGNGRFHVCLLAPAQLQRPTHRAWCAAAHATSASLASSELPPYSPLTLRAFLGQARMRAPTTRAHFWARRVCVPAQRVHIFGPGAHACPHNACTFLGQARMRARTTRAHEPSPLRPLERPHPPALARTPP